MAQILLCIDDHPEAFKNLKEIFFDINPEVVVIISCRYQEILEYLYGPHNIIGILLKFNLPFGTGYMFGKMLNGKSIPVILTENDKYFIAKIKEGLEEIKYSSELVSVIDLENPNWAFEVIELLSGNSEQTYIKDYLLKKYIDL